MKLIPEIQDLLRLFEDDLAFSKFDRVAEFEAFADQVQLQIYQVIDEFNQNKIQVL